MPRSDSGRIVVDLDPEMKKDLYSALQDDETNLRSWLIKKASAYIDEKKQPSLFGSKHRYLTEAEKAVEKHTEESKETVL